MLTLLIGLLTFVIVVDCLILILLVLVQLPKKEAGIGMAFGAGTTDALFGAGSGNALTKITKYAAAIFFVAAIGMSSLNSLQARQKLNAFDAELQKKSGQPGSAPAAIPTNALTTTVPLTSTTPLGTNMNLLTIPTNAVAPAAK